MLHASFSSTPVQGNRTLALLSNMFNLAELWGYRPSYSNPCRHVKRYTEWKRRRVMQGGEAVAIASALQFYAASRPQAVAFIYLLILSGARKGEIAKATWGMVEGTTLRLPDSKTGAKAADRYYFANLQGFSLIVLLPFRGRSS